MVGVQGAGQRAWGAPVGSCRPQCFPQPCLLSKKDFYWQAAESWRRHLCFPGVPRQATTSPVRMLLSFHRTANLLPSARSGLNIPPPSFCSITLEAGSPGLAAAPLRIIWQQWGETTKLGSAARAFWGCIFCWLVAWDGGGDGSGSVSITSLR